MHIRWKRKVILLLAGALGLLLLFLPGLPWSARSRHAVKRAIARAEMKIAHWRGNEPRLVSIFGQVNEAGVEVQALDSRSGWASLSDNEGNFVLRDVLWYPIARYDLVISSDVHAGRLITVRAPQTFPERGAFNVGALDFSQGETVELASLVGVNSATDEDFDSRNAEYYKDSFENLTSGKQSDEERIGAINDYVATRLTYDQAEPEPVYARLVLERGSRYCGRLSNAMRTLLASGGYRTRVVNMVDENDPPSSHAVVEVFYSGGWHLYDPTYGVKFRRGDGQIASYRDVRLDPTLITEDLFVLFGPGVRRQLSVMLQRIYKTGYHHFYYFRGNR